MDQYFQGGVLFWRTFSTDAVFVFVLQVVWFTVVVHTPFQISIGGGEKKKT